MSVEASWKIENYQQHPAVVQAVGNYTVTFEWQDHEADRIILHHEVVPNEVSSLGVVVAVVIVYMGYSVVWFCYLNCERIDAKGKHKNSGT